MEHKKCKRKKNGFIASISISFLTFATTGKVKAENDEIGYDIQCIVDVVLRPRWKFPFHRREGKKFEQGIRDNKINNKEI